MPPDTGAGVSADAWEGTDLPGKGCGTGFVLETDLGFCDGPPAFKSLPDVIGRIAPGFLFAGGRDMLLEGSPEGT